MKVVTDIRKSTPVLAVVGVTDLAVGAIRTAQADLTVRAAKAQGKAVAGAEALRSELTPAKLQANAQNVPNLAITKTLAAAGKAEQTYSELATRGKSLVNTVRRRSATKDLLSQGRSTLTLGKAAVTTVRKAGDDTLGAAKATVTTARGRSTNVARAAKATRTSAVKTVDKAVTATETAAAATGRPTVTRKSAAKPAARKTTTAATSKPAARKTTARKTTASKSTTAKPATRKTAARKTATPRKTTARKSAS
jgi:heparin binding hemagglutinin HbhA